MASAWMYTFLDSVHLCRPLPRAAAVTTNSLLDKFYRELKWSWYPRARLRGGLWRAPVSRNGNRFASFDPLCESIALFLRARSAVLDVEIVCLDSKGHAQLNYQHIFESFVVDVNAIQRQAAASQQASAAISSSIAARNQMVQQWSQSMRNQYKQLQQTQD